MAKVTLNTITSSRGSADLLNANFTAIASAINTLLSRDGTAPNYMEAELDMNSNDIINAAALDVDSLTINGTLVTTTELAETAIPSQTGFNGRYLYTNGSAASWLAPPKYVVATVAAMEALTYLDVGDIVQTLGYTSAGDRGGNIYEVVAASTGTDDGGRYIDLAGSSKQAHAKFPYGLNVKQFGAVGDGVTDDTTALQAAIDAVSETGAGIVLFPRGEYLISSTLTVDENNVTLKGEGATGSSNSLNNLALAQTDAATRIVWDSGASTTVPMIVFEPVLANIVGFGGGIKNMVVDGVNVADTCVEFRSWFHSDNENLLTIDGTWTGLSLTSRDLSGETLGVWSGAGSYVTGNTVTGSNGIYYTAIADGGEAEDPTVDTNNTYWKRGAEGCVFNTFRMYQHWSPTSNGKGVTFWRKNAGGIGANNNFFYQANIKTKGGSIEAVSFQESDHNAFFGLHCNGAGVVFHADDTGDSIADKSSDRTYSRHNAVYYCNSGSGTSKATVAGSVSADFNLVEVAPGDGGAIRNWTIEDGSILYLKHSFSVSGADTWGSYEIGKSVTTARLKLNADEAIATGGTTRTINWDAVDYEVTDIWNVSNPSYIIIPQGCYAVKFTANIYWEAVSAGTYRKAWIVKDTGSGFATFNGMPEDSTVPISANSVSNNLSSGWIECEPGDKFELRIAHDEGSNTNVLSNPRTWWHIDCR